MLGVGSNLGILKLEPTTTNSHVATHHNRVASGWQHVCDMLPPTILQYVALKCCGHLAGGFRVLQGVLISISESNYI